MPPQITLTVDLSAALADLPSNAAEAVVSKSFVQPLIQVLGFQDNECHPMYPTGRGADKVDFAVRKNIGTDIFLISKQNPNLLVEVKAAHISLKEGTPQYLIARDQLKRYLLSPNCQNTQWGIVTNSNHIQLFRKHGKVVVPATPSILITPNNINEKVGAIKTLIENPPRALTICIYNNKGGIGKTTTTINLAGTLASHGKRVLVLDFDSHQGDLTQILQIKSQSPSLFECMLDRGKDIKKTVQIFISDHKRGKESRFDVIPADPEMAKQTDVDLVNYIQGGIARLRDVLSPLMYEYDYILIDSSPNWTFFSQSSLYASDAALIPTRADDVRSLENAAITISQSLPAIQKEKGEGGPISLPIFFNGPLATNVQVATAKNRLKDIARRVEKDSNFKLTPYFFPKHTNTTINEDIFQLRGNASITKGAFLGILATLMHKTAADYYKAMAKEYFLQ
jgi:cellulose biosynthesis protein BcsQ